MQNGQIIQVTSAASAELVRLSSFSGRPGYMHLDLVEDTSGEGWMHIRLRSGGLDGVPISRTDGMTLYAPFHQLEMLRGLSLNYYGDLSGGGFLIGSKKGFEGCTCGAGFRILK